MHFQLNVDWHGWPSFFKGKKELGILYIGMSKTNLVFHKYFEVKSPKDTNIFLQKNGCQMRKNDAPEHWISQEHPFSLDVSSEGVLTFSYSDDHAIEIYPISSNDLQKIE